MANLGHNPEVEDVDAGVALAGNGVDRQVEGPCPAAPRQTRLARISFDGGDELVGDFGVKVTAFGCGCRHGRLLRSEPP